MDLLLNSPEISTEMLGGNFLDLMLRFGLNLLATIFVIIFVYFRATGKRSYVFTYILISTTIFFLCFLLGSIDLQLGFALGLFAIFGIIRYRTDTIPIREMTYLFLVITLSVINALASREVSISAILFTNSCLMATTWVMETVWMKRHLARRSLIFDRMDLIHPSKKQELIDDIMERTGIEVVKFKVGQIDLSKMNVRLTIFYKEETTPNVLSDPEMSDKSFDQD
ncbi:DUF4956 domain-containing protein [Ancylomarina euxinus]|uniref:DUF4956 domain-containing protein n=1 Tax=Ancylomarina euxinus TaxID=2283627 RepID=A0A425XYQ9_9BACT|nr:DUF4956 domain-containing protein [Ancylomarina euxinus]MCZ4695683.1 DUF4956 domain-containing protein [Ancylomarina euxinus]MUP16013.1 DUF4956 domain-containing protein [Ancylomarina euxinus]RRG20259.1 DUF4956 domain-containing protein [Ancylomarina euxinus]